MLGRTNAKEELVKFREAHGITQERLSVKTGLSKTTIVNIENGKLKPHATTIFKINKYIKTVTNKIIDY